VLAQELLERYTSLCYSSLGNTPRALAFLRKLGIVDRYIIENFQIGYADGSVIDLIRGNGQYYEQLTEIGIVAKGKETLKNHLTIPVYDDNKTVINIIGYNFFPKTKRRTIFLNNKGIFNHRYLRNSNEIILTDCPTTTLLLIQSGAPNSTFCFGPDHKYSTFIRDHGIRRGIFAFEGRSRLFYELSKNGVSTKRIVIDINRLRNGDSKTYLDSICSGKESRGSDTSDTITEIENGFLFRYPHLSYRVIGNFVENALSLKANIKIFTETDSFVDTVDLYRNRERQNLIYHVMDRFSMRDQIQIESDLTQIIEVIEKHKEKKALEKKKIPPELTDFQKDQGLRFLQNANLMDEIDNDYTRLGYVREKKNKILLYLVMTSRLMDNPLHSILISRSGAGKSHLVEITEELCPPESLESVSDLSAQALYYYGTDDLKHRFIVIGEKEGSAGAEYPLRELISKKSITKALPMKDPVTGQIKTISIRVNGPISLVETTTNGELHPENLNRCFVVSIDESEEQTRSIHEHQRKKYTLQGYLERKKITKVIEKHIFAQRLLRKIPVFNPYAKLLTFPSSNLKTRRDHEKFLRLINAICFLHQFQRKVKTLRIGDHESIEYIECTPYDYKIAHELLSDGVLDNTLDDLPRPARHIFEIMKKYLDEKSKKENIPVSKLVFERKDIREYSSWSFAQIRNNFRILRDYEYIQLIKAKNGTAFQYRLNHNYSDIDFLNKILTPVELAKRINEAKNQRHPTMPNIPEYSGSVLVTQ